jgi:hypothetical protein
MSIRKYSIFCSWYNFFSANVSDIYTYFTVKIKNFELYISTKNQAILTLSNKKKLAYFEALYKISIYKKKLSTFFFFPFLTFFVVYSKIFIKLSSGYF